MSKRTHTADSPARKKVSKTHTKNIINNQADYAARYLSAEPLDVFCWGTGSMCELGLGPLAKNKEVKRPRLNAFLPKDSAKIVSFAVGGMHTIALDADNNIWSWGCNDVGALGRDTSGAAEKLKDMDAAGNDDSDDNDGDLNELESTPSKIDMSAFPAGAKVVQLAALDNLSCALLDDGSVYAWGTFRCNEGILGFYRDEIKVQRTPWAVPRFSQYDIVQMAGGKDHILFLDQEGIVFAWGNGQQNQLGRKIMDRYRLKTLDPRPFGLRHVKYIASGENHSFALDAKGKLVSWGLNQFGQCGTSTSVEDGALVTKPTKVLLPEGAGEGTKKIRQISAGEHHSLVLLEDGTVLSCGRLDMCEAGFSKDDLPEQTYRDEHGKARSVPVLTALTKGADSSKPLPSFKYVAAGSHHSVAIAQNGIAYSWGFGETYALGLGPDDSDVAVPTRIKNTATQDHRIVFAGCGGQFSVSGGVALSDDAAEKRADEMDD